MAKLSLVIITTFLFLGCADKEPQTTKRLYKNDKAMYQKFLMEKSTKELDEELNKNKK